MGVHTGSTNGDVLSGDGTADAMAGLAGSDTLAGGAGNDTLTGGSGNDSLDGGAGFDTVDYTSNSASVTNDGGPAALTRGVTVNLATGTATDNWGHADSLANVEHAWGSEGDDSITGNGSDNSLYGGGGNDTLEGGIGSDFLVPGSGNDRVSGGAGNGDMASYQLDLAGSDTPATTGIFGSLVTNLVIDAWGDVDTLDGVEQLGGTDFADTLVGGNPLYGSGLADGFEGFRGNGGNDLIDGGAGFDRVTYDTSTSAVAVQLGGLEPGTAQDGLGGIDTLRSIEEVRGSDFHDMLFGNDDGSYESFEGRQGNDTIDGGGAKGINRINFQSAPAGIVLDLSAGTVADGYGTTDSFRNIDSARGTDFNDAIKGDGQDNDLDGRAGNDLLQGGDGEDTMRGGAGDDTIDGGAQRLLADGGVNFGSGFDWVLYSEATAGMTVVLGEDGTNGTATGGGQGTDRLVDIERVVGSDFGDLLRGTNRNVTEFFRGGKGNDTIFGGAETGTDAGTNNFIEFHTAGGAEVINLATGTATGPDGNDQFFGIQGVLASPFDDTITGDTGNNYIDGRLGDDSMDGGAGIDMLGFVNATAAVFVSLATGRSSGAEGNDTFTGFENVRGSEFADTIGGDGGANRLQAHDGADSVDGAGGNDTLHGGFGDDVLTGGAGNDQFQYGAAGGEGVDRITDFGAGDVIRIGAPLAGGGVTTGATPSGKAVQAQAGAGFTTLFIDTDGTAGAEIQLRLDGAFDISKFSVANAGGAALVRYDTPVAGLAGHAYAWKNHALLSGASIEPGNAGAVVTGADGAWQAVGVTAGDSVVASRGTADSGSAVNSADALAALRIAVGVNPNANGLQLSPYQLIAADVNDDGRVNSADALAILRMAVKAPTAPAQKWIFVNESLDLWNEAAGTPSLSRTAAAWQNPAVNTQADPVANFVGVLRGDVNGSWVAPAGSQVLDAAYFQAVGARMNEPMDVFGF